MLKLRFDAFDLPADEVRARFDWAKRRSTPSWLWPDVALSDWHVAVLSVQTAVRSLFADGDATAELAGDPGAMSVACYTTGMGPLLGWWHAHGRIVCGEDIGGVLGLHLEHNRVRSSRLAAATSEVIEALQKDAIAVATLKGADTGPRYFPDPATRPASDIDLLIDPADADRAEQIFHDLGYRLAKRLPRESDWRPTGMERQLRSLMLVHADDPWSIDLHVSIDIEQAAGLSLIRLDRAEPLKTATRLGDGGYALSQPLQLIYLAAHASTGLHNLTLLRLVELQFVIAHDLASGALNWNQFVAIAGEAGALGAIWPAMHLADRLIGGRIPADVLDTSVQAAPPRVRRIVRDLDPIDAQRFRLPSLAEHFMWADGPVQILRQLMADVVPGHSLKDVGQAYRRRLRRLRSDRVSR